MRIRWMFRDGQLWLQQATYTKTTDTRDEIIPEDSWEDVPVVDIDGKEIGNMSSTLYEFGMTRTKGILP